MVELNLSPKSAGVCHTITVSNDVFRKYPLRLFGLGCGVAEAVKSPFVRPAVVTAGRSVAGLFVVLHHVYSLWQTNKITDHTMANRRLMLLAFRDTFFYDVTMAGVVPVATGFCTKHLVSKIICAKKMSSGPVRLWMPKVVAIAALPLASQLVEPCLFSGIPRSTDTQPLQSLAE